ncbi:MAG TPA: acyltransferase [Methanofastidiosum sp.]|nr:acyltransferase [Methanofastidiosum sp.]
MKIGHTAMVYGWDVIKFGSNIIIDDYVFIDVKGTFSIDDNVHISFFSTITGGADCSIGKFVTISVGSHIIMGTDDFIGDGFGNPTISDEFRNVKRAPVFIGDFVRIGANSVILPGITIGEGSTIGAGSVVTKNLDPWGVYIGNKRIKDRDKEGVLSAYNKYKLMYTIS